MDSLLLLEEFGNTLREPHSKPMGNGIFELRIKFSSDISRIFYLFFADNKIIKPFVKLNWRKNIRQIMKKDGFKRGESK